MQDQSGSVAIQENLSLEEKVPMQTAGESMPPKMQIAYDNEQAKLNALVDMAGTVLYETSSVFPFQLFPDKLIVEPTRIVIIHKGFLRKSVHPVNIENLTGVNVSRGILFANITFEISGFDTNPGDITLLWPKKAAFAKRFIMGLVNAAKHEIDLKLIPINELRNKIEEIGRSEEEVDKLL